MSEQFSSLRSAGTRKSTKVSSLILSALALSFCGPVASLMAQTPTPVTVPTWRYDLTHAGQNTNETALTPANVNVSSFGKLFSVNVDSTTYPQPLYVPGLTINGSAHNVLFVATSNDSLYAFDADSNGGANANPLWQVSMLSASHGAGTGATAVPWQDTASPDVTPTIGITGTPTINPAINTLYLVSATKENGAYFSRLHAINILTGAEQPNSPVVISATVPGTGNGSSSGQLSFSPLWQNQRGALDYYNGYIYFGYGAHGDNGPWHGWLFAYNATTLAQSAVICTSPNGYGAGIWEAGAGLPIDSDVAGGRLFLTTGNGSFTTYPPFNANTELGEGVTNFSLANGGLTATDAFTSFNGTTLNNGDLDEGSGGLLMVPDQQGSFPHELVQAGKEGRIVVLNRDHLGGFAGASAPYNTNIPQDIPKEIKGLWSTPAYWNGNVYTWGNGDVPKLFQINSGVLSTAPVSQSTISSAFPGASFSISSNGTQDGIAWATRTDQFNSHGAAVLYAWAANDLTNTIYESDTNSARDAAGPANKFSIPVVTNGKVYIAENTQVDVYGLFNNEPTAAAPTISPDGGAFAVSQNVALSSTTATATIYYTLDGTVPTPASTLYSEPITVSDDTTVRAFASAPGYVQSGVSSATFTFTDQTPTVTFLPAPGTYSTAQQITLSDTDSSAKIYYTTTGATPTASSTLYTGPITVGASETIAAIAIDPAEQNSNVATAAYVIQAAGSSINFGGGFSSTTGLTLNGSTLATNDTRLQLTNGQKDESGSMFWSQPTGIQQFTTDFEFQLSLAQGDGFTFAIQNVGPTALGGAYGGLAYAGIGKSVAIKFDFYNNAGEGNDSTGVFTDGALPTVPAVDLTPSGIELNSGDSIQAHITYDGTTLTMNLLDLVNNKTFTLTKVINIPQIVGGNTAYVGFTGSTGGLTSSQKILSWTFTSTAQPVTAAPVFTPVAGAYTTAQSVAIISPTQGAVIYYTTNGTTPTMASTVYSGPMTVGTGTTTIEAIAVASGSSPSAVVTAKYIVGGNTPINFANGFSSSAGLALNQAATVTNEVLQMTLLGSATDKGSAWFSTPVNISSFTTDFQFQLLSPTADGFTFTIQNQGLTAIGPGGSGLGYGASKTGGTGGIGKSVAVKFDIYSNQGEGTDSTGFYSDGAAPTIPAIDMTASGVVLKSGDVFHAHITYDGTNLTLVLTDTKTSKSFTYGSPVNIPSIVGSGTAYVGFTGGIGGQSMTTQIQNWTLTN
jgi:Legume lectin domain/Chitobiase/beta-hexosaminidase C-terminal domain